MIRINSVSKLVCIINFIKFAALYEKQGRQLT